MMICTCCTVVYTPQVNHMLACPVLLALVLLILLLIPVDSSCQGNLVSADYFALQDLYFATDGVDWNWNESDVDSIWSFPSDVSIPCTNNWQGLICMRSNSTGDCFVSALFLSNYNLHGQIPTSIGSFASLDGLFLEFNFIHGTIPTEMGLLAELENLYLGNSFLTGTIPSELSLLLSLQEFYIPKAFLSGSLPEELFQYCNMTLFVVASNRFLNGTLPFHSAAKLSHIWYLDVSFNTFSGLIPTEVGLMQPLSNLLLYGNVFSGTIPSTICLLNNLTQLQAGENNLTYPLPSCLVQVTSLQILSLQSMQHGSTIPEFLYQMTSLTSLYLTENYLTGYLSSKIGDWTNMAYLDLSNNLLQGTIPTEISLLSNLGQIYLTYNLLTKEIPNSFRQMSRMISVVLSFNYFTGSLPSAVDNMTVLQSLEIGNCFLSGSVPSSVMALPVLTELNLDYNLLTGSIPLLANVNAQYLFLNNNQFSGQVSNKLQDYAFHCVDLSYNRLSGPLSFLESIHGQRLVQLELSFNSFTGTIPSEMSKLALLEMLLVNNNIITGLIPSQIGLLTLLKSFDCHSNYITGSIPSEFSQCPVLQSIFVADNYLTGTIPFEINQIYRLQSFNASMNSLTGQLHSLFGPESKILSLEYFDVSQNQLSGEIPNELFSSQSNFVIQSLEAVILYQNCFSGSLPPNICQASNLTALVLDAASCASSCCVKMGRILISKKLLKGTIPECVWSMPSLETLHLSGNGIEGSLGELLPGVSAMIDVDFSSNQIVGTLPLSWQQWGRFEHLDATNNKISGTLSSTFQLSPTSSVLDLSVNRLSGDIPSVFKTAPNINILGGNLFDCTSESLPESDPNSQEYVCGSDDLNYSLLAWLGGCLFVAIMAVSFARVRVTVSEWAPAVVKFDQRVAERGLDLPHVKALLELVKAMAMMIATLTILYLVVVMTGFLAMKMSPELARFYSTHTVQYVWTTTVAYLHGVAPCVLISSAFYFSIAFTSWRLQLRVSGIFSWLYESVSCHGCGSSLDRWDAMKVVGLILIHMWVAVTVNIFYVYALIQGISSSSLIVLQFFLSIFKLSWNNLFMVRALKRLNLSPPSGLLCSCFVSLFSFLVSPLVATFFSDTTCFRYLITGQPSVSSSFYAKHFECDLHCEFFSVYETTICHNYCGMPPSSSIEIVTVVAPSWLYSFQCSSSLITNYVPVLIFAYIISGLIIPFIRVCYLFVPIRVIDNHCPVFLQELFHHTVHIRHVDPLLLGDPQSGGRPKHVLNAIAIISKNCLNVAVLMTFGLASPLLAIAVAADTWNYFILWRVVLWHYIRLYSSYDAVNNTTHLVDVAVMRLESAAVGVLDKRTITHVMLMIFVVACLFWSVFVFDMIGDVYGSRVGGACVSLTVAGPLGWYIFCELHARCGEDSSLPGKSMQLTRNSDLYRTSFESITSRIKSTTSLKIIKPTSSVDVKSEIHNPIGANSESKGQHNLL